MNTMSKKIFFVLILFSAISLVSAERIDWIRNYNFGGDIAVKGIEAILTSDGNLMYAGAMISHNSIWLVKTDEQGQVLWNKTIPNPDYRFNYPKSISETSDGGFLILSSGAPIEGRDKTTFNKVNGLGNAIWNVSFNGSPMTSVITTDNGSLYVTAYERINELSEYEYYWRFVKTDANGTILWNKSLAKNELEHMESIMENPDGSYMAIGCIPHYGYRVLLTKLDSNANLLWKKTLNNTIDPEDERDDYGIQIQNAPDGGYIVLAIENDANTWLIKIDPNGEILWNKTYSGSREAESGEIISKYLRPTNDGYITIGVSGWYYVWMIKTDLLGNMVWNKTIRADHKGIVNVLGTSDGGDLIWTRYSGETSDWILIKTDHEGNLLWNITTPILEETNSITEDLDGNYLGTGYLGDSILAFKMDNTTTTTTTTSTTTTLETTTTTQATTTSTTTLQTTTTTTPTTTSTTTTIQPTTTTAIPTTFPTTIATTTIVTTTTISTITSTSTTSSTTTTLGNCSIAGNLPPCGEISLSEVVAYINEWATGEASLSDVIALINAWATG